VNSIEVKVNCVLTFTLEVDEDESLTAPDLGKWVNEEHVEFRRAVESSLRLSSAADLWFDENTPVYLMDLVSVDAQIPKTWGVTTLEWSES
jgi:hypothetical protein